jgi:hypothetical protein
VERVARRSIDIVLHSGSIAMRWGNPEFTAEVGGCNSKPQYWWGNGRGFSKCLERETPFFGTHVSAIWIHY